MEQYSDFMGRDGFLWFVGVVEDRQDPDKLGRVRVRCLGFHTDDKKLLPTSDLPWSHPLLPITSSGISGIGQTPLGLVEGSWVLGFFRDGKYAQEPVILGTLPGRPTYTGAEQLQRGLGFSDPNGVYPRYKNEPDTNRLAVNDEIIPIVEFRKLTRITGIPTANIISLVTADAAPQITGGSDGDLWSQPENTYAAEYPYNHVYETESGHIREYDDTPNARRILEYHASGTETEITNEGTRTTIIKDSDYNITEVDSKIYIKGDKDVTVGGRYKIFLNTDGAAGNHYDIQVGPNANVNIQVDKGDINLQTIEGNMNMNIGGDYNLLVGGDYKVKVLGVIEETSFKTTTRRASSRYHTFGSPIDHN